jgi:hypothetical protein
LPPCAAVEGGAGGAWTLAARAGARRAEGEGAASLGEGAAPAAAPAAEAATSGERRARRAAAVLWCCCCLTRGCGWWRVS